MRAGIFQRNLTMTAVPAKTAVAVSASAIKAQPSGQPLDRAAAVVYGDFVGLAYDIFGHPAIASTTVPAGFHVTAYIYMYDFVFFARRKKFYGLIATQDDDPYSHILAIRGTEGWWEWWDDALLVPTTFRPVPDAGPVHGGFYRIYKTMLLCPLDTKRPVALDEVNVPDADSSLTFADQLEAFLNGAVFCGLHADQLRNDAGSHHFIVTGHSLGAALCTLYVMEHAIKKLKQRLDRQVTIERVCTFASPRVGTGASVEQFHSLPIDSWRIVNAQDIVPKVPLEVPFDYRHVEDAYLFTSENVTRLSPSCWHDMRTYINWLDEGRAIEDGCVTQVLSLGAKQ